MKQLFDSTSFDCSKLVTKTYSTSFSIGTLLIDKKIRKHIYAIYGFVRYADEIVDSFHEFDKQYLLKKFKVDTYESIDKKISLNPILNSFQNTVNTFNIEKPIIDAFLHSMEMDLSKVKHDLNSYKEYIYGSAEVVGLMCLSVFVEGNKSQYEGLKNYALALGAAFQKVNFLRDLRHDNLSLGRNYFPHLEFQQFDSTIKLQIEDEIERDFQYAYQGIVKLPQSSKLGVYVAFVYYYSLFKKIQNKSVDQIMEKRIRINDPMKIVLLTKSYIKHSLNLVS